MSLTTVKLEQQPDREVVEEAAVQYERYQRCQSALSSGCSRFGSVGVKLAQNFIQEKHSKKNTETYLTNCLPMLTLWIIGLTCLSHLQSSFPVIQQLLCHIQPRIIKTMFMQHI